MLQLAQGADMAGGTMALSPETTWHRVNICFPDCWASSGLLRPGRTLMAAIINGGVKYIISDIPEYEEEV
jgi:hypothetical protein